MVVGEGRNKQSNAIEESRNIQQEENDRNNSGGRHINGEEKIEIYECTEEPERRN
jgi:hypothetical protein